MTSVYSEASDCETREVDEETSPKDSNFPTTRAPAEIPIEEPSEEYSEAN